MYIWLYLISNRRQLYEVIGKASHNILLCEQKVEAQIAISYKQRIRENITNLQNCIFEVFVENIVLTFNRISDSRVTLQKAKSNSKELKKYKIEDNLSTLDSVHLNSHNIEQPLSKIILLWIIYKKIFFLILKLLTINTPINKTYNFKPYLSKLYQKQTQ